MKNMQPLSPMQQSKNRLAFNADQTPSQPIGEEPSLMDEEHLHGLNGDKTVNEINELLGREEYTSVYPRLSELADKDNQNTHINVAAGLVALSVGKRNDAARYFERALQANPEDVDALHNRAVLALSYGDIETARNCFVRLSELKPAEASV